jgi:TolB-like protein
MPALGDRVTCRGGHSGPGISHTDFVTSIPEADIRAELDRILASKSFSSAGRMSKLLRFVVDKTLAGETDQLKEYSVGIEVFERDHSYDPRLDSIVRVEAGRLRNRLDEYYNGEGAASALRVSLPKGGYSAQFNRPQAPQPAVTSTAVVAGAQPVRRSATVPLAAVLLVAIAAMVFWLGSRDRTPAADLRPTAAVLPFEANMIGGDNSNYSALITEAVTSELARLGTISVTSYTSAMQFEGQRRPMHEIAAALRSAYVVEASVDDEASEILVVARIVDTETDRKIWVSDYRGQRDDVRGIAQRIAFDVSAELLKR